MRAFHTAAAVSAIFNEPNLVSWAGLVPVLRLAERAGLHAVAQRRVRLPACATSRELAGCRTHHPVRVPQPGPFDRIYDSREGAPQDAGVEEDPYVMVDALYAR